MKSLAELAELREKMKKEVAFRQNEGGEIKVIVGMATCGIAAGARPVLSALLDETLKRNLKNVRVAQAGCIGMCKYEPIVEVFEPGKEKVTYVKVDPEKVSRIVVDHLVNGQVVTDLTIGAAQKEDRDKEA